MKKVFIKNEEDNIKFIHYKPFDNKHGLNKTEEELNVDGKVVYLDEESKPQPQKGYFAQEYYDKETNTVKYRLKEEEE